MKVWILKAVIQKLISFLPWKHRINFLFQKYITKGLTLTDDLMVDKLKHLASHIQAFEKHSTQRHGEFTAMELGTGWYPIVPLGLFIYGAGKVYTVDISPLLTLENIDRTIRKMHEFHESGKLQAYLPRFDVERLDKLKELANQKHDSPQSFLVKINIHALIEDARKLPLPDQSIDLITSNNTFEHIYPEILKDILIEFKRVLKPGGCMAHFIDMSDHFAHLDKSISIYNFLKYSETQWKLIDNSIQPQNRLRLPQYLELYKQALIEVAEIVPRQGNITVLSRIKIDKPFQKYSGSELAISHALVISV